ncbi:Kinetochore protein Mis14 like domain containing protein [Elaphomyces granulatus]
MQTPHHRKIELQSPADLTYLYANTVALARQKLDLHLPSSASNDPNTPDPMRERVRELTDEFITQTFTSALASISINGIDFVSSSGGTDSSLPFSATLTTPETVEYEPYDGALAARVTSLYAQLESLTTTVAQLRRDAPKRAAKAYADALAKALAEDNAEAEALDREAKDFEMANGTTKTEEEGPNSGNPVQDLPKRTFSSSKSEWKLQVPLGSDHEAERWRHGDMAETYSDALRTLLRLQGEVVVAGDDHHDSETADGSRALATTVGQAERAVRATEVVERM